MAKIKLTSVDEIKEIKAHYEKTLYPQVRAQQREDQSYRDDTFNVDDVIKNEQFRIRSGIGSKIIDSALEQLAPSEPQAFFEVIKGGEGVASRLSKLLNEHWLPLISRGNPNPIDESIYNKLSRGEDYIRVIPNQNWLKDPIGKDTIKVGDEEIEIPIFNTRGLPVFFLVPDPMVIYGSPEEDDCGWLPDVGVPNRVLTIYERQPLDVILKYGEKWSNPKKAGIGENIGKRVEWFEYIDKSTRYCEADGEQVYYGRNIYGFVNFVRQRSGFGHRSPDGSLAELIVGDLRMSRDLIRDECITRSNISMLITRAAHRARTAFLPGEYDQEQLKELHFGIQKLNVLQNWPEGAKLELEEPILPEVPMLSHLAEINARLERRHPFITAGFPQGESGRHQDLAMMAALRRYKKLGDNTGSQWGTAIEMSIKMGQRIPGLMPKGLTEADLNAEFNCVINLKTKDLLEADKLATLGDRLWAQGQGSISLKRNLMKYQGMTEDEANYEIGRVLAERAVLYHPDPAAALAAIATEESGLKRFLEELKAGGVIPETGQTLGKPPPRTTMERIQGETQTPLGREQGTMEPQGARNPPSRYTRGG